VARQKKKRSRKKADTKNEPGFLIDAMGLIEKKRGKRETSAKEPKNSKAASHEMDQSIISQSIETAVFPDPVAHFSESRKDYTLFISSYLIRGGESPYRNLDEFLKVCQHYQRILDSIYDLELRPPSRSFINCSLELLDRAREIGKAIKSGKSSKFTKLMDDPILCWMLAPRMMDALVQFSRELSEIPEATNLRKEICERIPASLLVILFDKCGLCSFEMQPGELLDTTNDSVVVSQCLRPGFKINSEEILPPLLETIAIKDIITARCPSCGKDVKLDDHPPYACARCMRLYLPEEWIHLSPNGTRADKLVSARWGLMSRMLNVGSDKQVADTIIEVLHVLSGSATPLCEAELLRQTERLLKFDQRERRQVSNLLVRALSELLHFFGEKDLDDSSLVDFACARCRYEVLLLEPPALPLIPNVPVFKSHFLKCSDRNTSVNPTRILGALDRLAVEGRIFEDSMTSAPTSEINKVEVEDLQSLWYYWVSFWKHSLRTNSLNRFISLYWDQTEYLLFGPSSEPNWLRRTSVRKDLKHRDEALINRFQAAQYMTVILPKVARRMLEETRSLKPLIPKVGLPSAGNEIVRTVVESAHGFAPGTVVKVVRPGIADALGTVRRRPIVDISLNSSDDG